MTDYSSRVVSCPGCGVQRTIKGRRVSDYCLRCAGVHRDDGRPPPGPWTEDAACRDSGLMPDSWWPDAKNFRHDPLAKAALAICGECPVRRECLDHAISVGEHDGIWGGMLPAQRKAEARSRRQRREADHWQAKADAARSVVRSASRPRDITAARQQVLRDASKFYRREA